MATSPQVVVTIAGVSKFHVNVMAEFNSQSQDTLHNQTV